MTTKKYILIKHKNPKVPQNLKQVEYSEEFAEKHNIPRLGGYIESEKNLSQEGNAQISGNAWVCGDAQISGNARVSGNAWVYGEAWVSGDVEISGDAWVSGDVEISKNISSKKEQQLQKEFTYWFTSDTHTNGGTSFFHSENDGIVGSICTWLPPTKKNEIKITITEVE